MFGFYVPDYRLFAHTVQQSVADGRANVHIIIEAIEPGYLKITLCS